MEEVTQLPTLAATRKLARSIAKRLAPGAVLALTGDLGAGKTTFVQALGRALAVEHPEEIVSPTYTLVNEYAMAGGWLIHIDLYRLTDAESAIALGLHDQLGRRDAILVVEWANRFPELLPATTLWLALAVDAQGKRTAILHDAPAT